MDIKGVVRLSGTFIGAIWNYPIYVRPARSRTEEVLRMKQQQKRKRKLRTISRELSACILMEVQE